MRYRGNQQREVWPPKAGHFRLRLCRNGWYVPAKIQYSPIEGWRAIIDENELQWNDDPAYAENVPHIWHYGLIVEKSMYDWCIDVKRWAEKEVAARRLDYHPSLSPREPIKRMRLPPFLPPQRNT